MTHQQLIDRTPIGWRDGIVLPLLLAFLWEFFVRQMVFGVQKYSTADDLWEAIISIFPAQKLQRNWRGYQYIRLNFLGLEAVFLLLPPGSTTSAHNHQSWLNPNFVLFGDVTHTTFNIRNSKLKVAEELVINQGHCQWLVKYQSHSIDVPPSASMPSVMLNLHFPARNL